MACRSYSQISCEKYYFWYVVFCYYKVRGNLVFLKGDKTYLLDQRRSLFSLIIVTSIGVGKPSGLRQMRLISLQRSINATVTLLHYLIPWFHISFILYTVFLRRARLTNAQSLADDYRSFGVVWMSREVTKILMAISRFYI